MKAGTHVSLIETSGNHRNAALITHIGINDSTKDEIDIGMSCFFDDGSRFIHLKEGQIWSASHIEQDTARSVDGDIQ